MKLRTQALQGVDPSRVPLPNGTEVTVTAPCTHDGRLVKQGAVGRVQETSGDMVQVRIVGVGVVRCQREDLIPRKRGQLEFAIRREEAWRALRPAVVLETTVGSRAWGLENEGSDTDIRGVFVLPFPWTAGLAAPPGDLVSVDGSTSFWEAEKTIRQALRGDPNTLETLFVDSAQARDPMGEALLDARDAFVSSAIYGTFGRYALSQLKRLSHNLRLADHREQLLGWLRDEPEQSLDDAAARLAKAVVMEGLSDTDRDLRAKQYIKQLYSSLYDQGLLAERSFSALAKASRSDVPLTVPRDLAPKNAYNLLRLLRTAAVWLRDGRPEFRVGGAFREELLAIKERRKPLSSVLERAEELAAELEDARQATALPDTPDYARADAALRIIREEAAKRWFAQEASIFGTKCPTPPKPEALT